MQDKKVAIVTGGSRGIGAAITSVLARHGVHVAAGFHRNREAAEGLADELRSDGGSVSIHQGNVAVPDDCQRVVAEVIDTEGRIDYLINNAGMSTLQTVRTMPIEDWHKVLRVNLSGVFYMSKAVLDGMLERRSGRIVNISSVVGQTGDVGLAHYCAAKSGLFGFTKSLALEVARKGITVNCVAPGYIDTEMLDLAPEDFMGNLLARIPVGRLGEAHEVAHAVQFLLSESAAYITGSVISVNGGLEM